jgi:hypothetical protein
MSATAVELTGSSGDRKTQHEKFKLKKQALGMELGGIIDRRVGLPYTRMSLSSDMGR